MKSRVETNELSDVLKVTLYGKSMYKKSYAKSVYVPHNQVCSMIRDVLHNFKLETVLEGDKIRVNKMNIDLEIMVGQGVMITEKQLSSFVKALSKYLELLTHVR
jgi:hypothetical protein